MVIIGCVSHPSGYFFTYLFFKTLQGGFIFDSAGSSLLREGFLVAENGATRATVQGLLIAVASCRGTQVQSTGSEGPWV